MNASATSNIGTWILENIDARAMMQFEDKAHTLKVCVKRELTNHLYQLPQGLYDLLFRWCILSGSSISSIYHNERPKDFDLWCKDADRLPYIMKAITEKYSDQIMTYSEQDGYDSLREGNQGDKKLITHNAITLKGNLQFITLGTYKSQRQMFDFMHCLPYYDLQNDKFYISENQMNYIASKKLVRNPIGKVPVHWRVEKFKNRGWSW